MFPAGFQFNQQMNGAGGGGGGAGGVFFTGGFTGFGGGGGAQMSGSAPQTGATQQQTDGQTGSPLQQQLFQIGESEGHPLTPLAVTRVSDL